MGRAAQALSGGMDLVLRALVLQGIWVLGTLAGGVVLGWAPATMAALDAAARAERGEPIRWRRTARVWKDSFVRSQVTLGLPGLFLVLAVSAALSGVLPTTVEIVLWLVAVLLLIALAHIPDLDRRYHLPATRVMGRSVVLGLAQAPTSLLMLAVLALWTAVVLAVPGLAPFLGVAVPLMVVHHLVDRSLDRNEDLLSRPAGPPDGHPARPSRGAVAPPRPRIAPTA
ncbi:DUF624 domain-containing protein [Brachybacterium sp.]|uniref:DUF624 domain-containing protein n=1 Tax=Brachybacterium sp. TaxID=1891286 RepID=UPI002ED3FA45